MNYRQWKKNYKKKHGCNPPLEVDKRKQVKVMRKALKQISLVDLNDICKGIVNGIASAFKIVGEAFINAGNSLEVKEHD